MGRMSVTFDGRFRKILCSPKILLNLKTSFMLKFYVKRVSPTVLLLVHNLVQSHKPITTAYVRNNNLTQCWEIRPETRHSASITTNVCLQLFKTDCALQEHLAKCILLFKRKK